MHPNRSLEKKTLCFANGKDSTDHKTSCRMMYETARCIPWFTRRCVCTLTCHTKSKTPQRPSKHETRLVSLFHCEIEDPGLQKITDRKALRKSASGKVPQMSSKMHTMTFILILGTLLSSLGATQPLDFNHNMSESIPENPEELDIQSTDLSMDDTKLSAKEFLGKFGYIQPAEWTSVSPRNFDESRSDIGTIGDETTNLNKDGAEEGSGDLDKKENNLINWSFEDISEEEYQRALIKYQRINGLNATGRLDNKTRSYMGRPRCGVPDRTAAIKVNRTFEPLKTRFTETQPTTTQTSTTDTEPTTDVGTTISSVNHTQAGNDETTSQIPIIIHAITTASLKSDSDGGFGQPDTKTNINSVEDDVGSGDIGLSVDSKPVILDDDHSLSRRRRSNDKTVKVFQMEAGFEEVTSLPGGDYMSDSYTHQDALDGIDLTDIRVRRLNFKDLNDAPISEAELPDEQRVASLENILEALRREKMSQHNATMKQSGSPTFDEMVTSIRPTPATPVPALVKRLVMDTRARRRKRSNSYRFGKTSGWLMAYPKPVITWRLVEEWPTKRSFMTSNEIWFTIKLAFRMWSEILPRNFREDNSSPMTNVDILLGFGTKEHNRCPVPFYDGRFTKEYAHAWPLPQAEVHFNDDQPFVSVGYDPSRDLGLNKSPTSYGFPISLLKVATHEIGHTLGLPHNKDKASVMNPVYIPYQSKKVVELEVVDRRAIQSVYGSCNIAFDAVFDWVRQYVGVDGVKRWKYNTFLFRDTWFWLYENRGKRPRYGDPKYSYNYWRGVLNPTNPNQKIDGVVHIRDWSIPNGPIYFFTGDTFTEYDSKMDKVRTKDSEGRAYPRKIKDGFPGIPFPIDTVFYKWQEKLLYFFKENQVYKFDWKKKRIVSFSTISSAFPGWGGATSLPNNIDAAYHSYTDSAYYFFKGMYYWKLADERDKFYSKGAITIPTNAVGTRKLITSKWKYICDVDITEMQMNDLNAKT